MLMVEFSFPFVRTLPIMLFMHVSFMMPWIIVMPWIVMMIKSITMTMIWADSMMIVMRIVLTLKVFWGKSVMDEIVWVLILVVLPFIVMASIMMKIMIILKMVVSMVISMVSSVETMFEMEIFIIFFVKMGQVMTIITVTMSKSMPFIVSPMTMTMVVRMCWIMDWLSLLWYPVNISIAMMVIVMVIWLHFQHKVSAMYKSL